MTTLEAISDLSVGEDGDANAIRMRPNNHIPQPNHLHITSRFIQLSAEETIMGLVQGGLGVADEFWAEVDLSRLGVGGQGVL